MNQQDSSEEQIRELAEKAIDGLNIPSVDAHNAFRTLKVLVLNASSPSALAMTPEDAFRMSIMVIAWLSQRVDSLEKRLEVRS